MKFSKKQKQEIFTFICESIINGESLRAAIVKTEISKSTFFDWINQSKAFTDQYTRAMEIRAELLFDEMLEIADTTLEGVETKTGVFGTEKKYADMLGHRTLQVNTRKWALSKMMPKKYGNNVDHEPKENNNLTVEVEYVDPKNDES